jgi:hypothetical protein
VARRKHASCEIRGDFVVFRCMIIAPRVQEVSSSAARITFDHFDLLGDVHVSLLLEKVDKAELVGLKIVEECGSIFNV